MDNNNDNHSNGQNGRKDISRFSGSRYNQGAMDNNAMSKRPSSRSLDNMIGARQRHRREKQDTFSMSRSNNIPNIANRNNGMNRPDNINSR